MVVLSTMAAFVDVVSERPSAAGTELPEDLKFAFAQGWEEPGEAVRQKGAQDAAERPFRLDGTLCALRLLAEHGHG